MPQQLIYTSSHRGLNPGASGYCTVAKSKGMSDFISARLEQLSYYRHLSLVANGTDRPIFCFRRLDVRGRIYYVITYLTNTELDFTQRTNFIAHHLVFNPDEITKDITPPIICKDWSGWVKVWNKEPELLESSIKLSLSALDHTKAQTWEEVTHDSAKAFGLLIKIPIAIDLTNENDDGDQKLLTMFSECLQLIEVQRPMDYKDGKAAWEYTFTTSLQAEDNPSDFRWCCVRSSNPPGFQKLQSTGQTAVRLNDIQAPTNLTPEKKNYAESGYQAPEVTVNGKSYKGEKDHNFSSLVSRQGETVKLKIERISGVPTPTCQWQRCSKDNEVWQSCKVMPTQNTDSSFIFKPEIPMAFTGEMYFYLSISNNRSEKVHGTFTVNITPIPPEISLQPVEKKAKIGSSVELKVVAKVKGIPDAQLTYQWYLIKPNEQKTIEEIVGANSPVYKINSIERMDLNCEYYVVVDNSGASIESEPVKISLDVQGPKHAEGSSSSIPNSPKSNKGPSSNTNNGNQDNERKLTHKILVGVGAFLLIAGLVAVRFNFGGKKGENSDKPEKNNSVTKSGEKKDPPKVGVEKDPSEVKEPIKYVAILNSTDGNKFNVIEKIREGIKGQAWDYPDDKNTPKHGNAIVDGGSVVAPNMVECGQLYKCNGYQFMFVQKQTKVDVKCIPLNCKFIEDKSEGGKCKIEQIEFGNFKFAATGESIGSLKVGSLKVLVSYKDKDKTFAENPVIDLVKKSVTIPNVFDVILSGLGSREASLTSARSALIKSWAPIHDFDRSTPVIDRPPVLVDDWTLDHIARCKTYLGANSVLFSGLKKGQEQALSNAMDNYNSARIEIVNFLGVNIDPKITGHLPQSASKDMSSLNSLPVKGICDKIAGIKAELKKANKTIISIDNIQAAYIIYDDGHNNTYRLFELKFD